MAASPRQGPGPETGRLELRERSEQLELAQEALGIVTWIWDIPADRVQWYGDVTRMLGLAPGSFSGRFEDYLARVHPEDVPRARQTYIDCLKGRHPHYRAMERVFWPDGSVRWLETHGRAEYGPDGRAVRMAGLVKDVTDAEQLERRAHQSERKFGALFVSSPEPVAIARLADGVHLDVNPAWARATGRTKAQAVGRSSLALGLWADPEARDALMAALRQDSIVHNRPARFRRADGEAFPVLVSGAKLMLDGEPCVVWTWRDISELSAALEKARQMERKFTSLFETSPVALVVSRAGRGAGAEDEIVEANDAALKMLGLARDRVIGARASAVVTWKDAAALERLRQRALRGERILGAPAQFDRHDGRRIEALLSGALLDIGGEPHFVFSMLDVTEPLRVEREKGITDARYRALFESATDGIVILSPQWEFVDLNPAACEFMGYARDELVGKPMTSVFSMEELEANPLRDRQWTRVERTLNRKDGRPRAIELQAAPMADGNTLLIARDISARRRHEQMIMNIARGVSAELGEAFFQSLVGHLARELEADFAFVAELVQPAADRFRTLAFVADGAAASNFDYPVEGSPCAVALDRRGTVIFPSGAAHQFPEDAGLARLGVEAYVGTSLLAADGSVLGVLVVMHRRPIERGPFWGSMIEIFGARAAAEIERARAEALVRRTNETLEQVVRERTAALEDANRDLESYNYSISHDLRQPLNAIAGFAELLRDAGADVAARERQEFLGEIESNAERMDRMIVSLLQLARAGRGPLTVSDVDMRALVDEVLRELAAGAPLKAKIEVGALPPARGDAHLLRQVWMNLIGNALKYSRKRRAPRVHIRGESRGDRIEYAVSDNGVGFDMRHVDRLFEAFHRLPTASSFEGSGVGLAIVHRILRRHGGQLIPESAPGKGATFRFTLPS